MHTSLDIEGGTRRLTAAVFGREQASLNAKFSRKNVTTNLFTGADLNIYVARFLLS
jgi:hypothetical protein